MVTHISKTASKKIFKRILADNVENYHHEISETCSSENKTQGKINSHTYKTGKNKFPHKSDVSTLYITSH